MKNRPIDKREERRRAAERLVEARKHAGFRGPLSAARKFGWNANNYKAHEQGRNGFDVTDARAYASAYGVSLAWLLADVGPMTIEDAAIFDAFRGLLPKAEKKAIDAALATLELGQTSK